MNLPRPALPAWFLTTSLPVFTTLAHATEGAPAGAPGSGSGDLLYLWVKVIAFLALLGAGAVLLNHYVRKKRPGMTTAVGAGRIHLADVRSLGNRQYLAVAQFGRERHLLGVTPSAINHLSRLGDAETVEAESEKSSFEGVLSSQEGAENASGGEEGARRA